MENLSLGMIDQIQHNIKVASLNINSQVETPTFGMMTAMQKEVIVLFNPAYSGPDLDVLYYLPLPQPRCLHLSIG